MAEAKALVLTGHGTNCERETAHTARIAGADSVVICHFADLIQGLVRVAEYNFLIFPGGFLDGDHLGAAQAAAARFTYSRTPDGRPLLEEILDLHQRGGLILGICNGFQLLAKLGLLPSHQEKQGQQVSLSHNDSARFEDRWIHLLCDPRSLCVFTRDLHLLQMPVRHGEGKLVPHDQDVLESLREQALIALRYAHAHGGIASQYPANPNGSPDGIAGLSDPTGRIFGLMPHPEAFHHPTNHPAWTRAENGALGSALFANAVSYLHALQD
ncbi:MAG: phosphoribosylformylglycinamidine synthase subunit PurQ [Desulfohalobiaceae bacterium]|nr:phosphoribosylformylglycinamidine synthase subunit PurQ [Desulfohalobiaceae bacterium]